MKNLEAYNLTITIAISRFLMFGSAYFLSGYLDHEQQNYLSFVYDVTIPIKMLGLSCIMI